MSAEWVAVMFHRVERYRLDGADTAGRRGVVAPRDAVVAIVRADVLDGEYVYELPDGPDVAHYFDPTVLGGVPTWAEMDQRFAQAEVMAAGLNSSGIASDWPDWQVHEAVQLRRGPPCCGIVGCQGCKQSCTHHDEHDYYLSALVRGIQTRVCGWCGNVTPNLERTPS